MGNKMLNFLFLYPALGINPIFALIPGFGGNILMLMLLSGKLGSLGGGATTGSPLALTSSSSGGVDPLMLVALSGGLGGSRRRRRYSNRRRSQTIYVRRR